MVVGVCILNETCSGFASWSLAVVVIAHLCVQCRAYLLSVFLDIEAHSYERRCHDLAYFQLLSKGQGQILECMMELYEVLVAEEAKKLPSSLQQLLLIFPHICRIALYFGKIIGRDDVVAGTFPKLDYARHV